MLDSRNQNILISNNVPVHGAEWGKLTSAFGCVSRQVKNYIRSYFFNISRRFAPVAQVKLGKEFFLRNISHKSSRQVVHSVNFVAHGKKQVINMTADKTG